MSLGQAWVNRFRAVCLLVGLLFGCLTGGARSQQIEFLEDFVLATNRQAALQTLVPGTDDYFYYHALDQQLREQYGPVEEWLKQWIAKFGVTDRVRELQLRQALLRYPSQPRESLDFIVQTLGLRFDQQRRIPPAEQQLPSKLDAGLLSAERLLEHALREQPETGGLEAAGLEMLAAKFEQLDRGKRRSLIARVEYPDFPRLVELLVDDLRQPDRPAFGAIPIHSQLTLNQLDQLAAALPQLQSEMGYVQLYCRKLLPTDDLNLAAEPAEEIGYQQRVYGYVKGLSPAFNSLKAATLHRLLDLQRQQGTYDREKFLEYLALPRRLGYLKPEIWERISDGSQLVDLTADCSGVTRCPPIYDELPLVRSYLQYFLTRDADAEAFAGYFEAGFFRRELAVAKILSGQGDPQRWAAVLSPEEYKALIDRVEIEFEPGNPRQFGLSELVKLRLSLKNVPRLLIKVFEINTENYYRRNAQEIGTDINLDGLVPNWEQVFDYTEPPAVRNQREFEFPQLDHRGVYVIDFIGAGISSRALVRKGELSFIQKVRPGGQELSVLDESGAVCKAADVWLGGRRFTADAEGRILIPFSTQPGVQPVVLRAGEFSALGSLNHVAEEYELTGGLYVDRESLLRLRTAPVLIRPSLRVAGAPIPLGQRLAEIQLKITLTNQDGQASTETITDLKLDERGEATCEFQVPPRLAAVTLELTAKIRVESRNEEQQSRLVENLTLNQIELSDEIADLHLLRSGRMRALEVRGLSGEPRKQVAVNLELKHRSFSQPVNVSLQSDERGVIELGELTDIEWLRATIVGGTPRLWSLLTGNFQTTRRLLHGLSGEAQQVLVPPQVRGLEDTALFELRSGLIVKDRSAELQLANEVLTLPGLPAGDFLLVFKPTRERIDIRVTAGREVAGIYRGQHRSLELRDQSLLRLEQVQIDQQAVTLQLKAHSEFTRVHVFATRFEPRFDAGMKLGRVRDLAPGGYQHAYRPNAYLSGRILGEEYQYILMRQLAKKFPGIQLARPSLLLNPWSLGPTDNRERLLAEGGDYGRTGEPAPAKDMESMEEREGRGAGMGKRGTGQGDFSSLDFLDQGTKVLANLRPDADGRIVIAREELGDKQHLVVVMVDLFQTVERTIVLPAQAATIRDLRLVEGFDPEKTLSLQQAATTLKRAEVFQVDDILTAKFSLYDDLGDVFSLLRALSGGSALDEFQFLTGWGGFKLEEKRELYSKHACHELHFFLYRRDPEFFKAVVRPFLANKLEKQFVDRWLLDEPLEEYLQPWQFDRLNAFERVLLARRLPEAKSGILRRLEEQRLVEPFEREQLNRLFEAALIGNPDSQPEGYLKKAEELKRNRAESLSPGRPTGGGGGGLGGGQGGFDANAPGAPPVAAAPEATGKKLAMSLGSGVVAADPKLDDKDQAGSRDEPAAGDALREQLDRRQIGGAEKFKDDFMAGEGRNEGQPQRFFQRIRPTEEWVESNYYRVRPGSLANRDLLPLNDFWIAWLRSSEEADFLSPDFTQLLIGGGETVERARSAAILALALLDLPFSAPKHELEYQENAIRWTLGGPAIMFHQQIRPAKRAGEGTTILVSENFFQKNNRYRQEGGLQFDRFLTGQFPIQEVYGAQVVITNPTSTPRVVRLVYQIPEGAIATSGSQETRTIPLQLNAFSSQSFEYYFYFPAAGKFGHFPAQVAAGEEILAVAAPFEFEVVEEPTQSDTTSWAYISQNGKAAEVLAFLEKANLLELNLEEIAFRMRDVEFFKAVTGLLRQRHVFVPTLWSYALLHNQPTEAREYLSQREDLIGQCGGLLRSELVTIDPVSRGWYEQREYWPLVHSRTHPVGLRREILNPSIHQQYHRLLRILGYRLQLTSDDQLALVYHLLLQDRFAEASERFALVQPGELNSRLQYDYCQAYLHLVSSQVDAAGSIAEQYRDYPVKHWQERYAAMVQQIAEIRGGVAKVVNEDDPAQVQAAAAEQTESFQFRVVDGKVELEYRNLKQLTMNLYAMDVEFSFSRNPFATGAEDSFAQIRPNVSQQIRLAAASGRQTIELPEDYRQSNLLVEFRTEELTRSEPVYANNLNVQFREAFGDLQVSNRTSGEFLPLTYVKVYGQRADGTSVFIKDGYSDLRGRFDYVTQSNVSLDGLQRLAVLVLNEEQGTLIRMVGMPKE